MLDLVPAFSFLFAVIGVYTIEGWLLVRSFIPRFRGPERSLPTRIEKIVKIALHATAIAGLICIAWGYFIEPTRLEVTKIQIVHPALSGHPPLKIALFSDLHCDTTARNEARLPGVIGKFNPHLVAFTGDSMNEKAAMPLMKKTLKEVSQAAPTALCLATRGNYDVYGWRFLDLFEGTGFVELGWKIEKMTSSAGKKRAGPFAPDNSVGFSPPPFSGPFMIPGFEGRAKVGGLAYDFWSSIGTGKIAKALGASTDTPETLDPPKPETFEVFLYHSPELPNEAAAAGADLYLCGHTHGGQIALPLYGALTTLSRHRKKYEAGLYEVPHPIPTQVAGIEAPRNSSDSPMRMYITRGVGMEGGWAPRVRFWVRPEVTLITVVGN